MTILQDKQRVPIHKPLETMGTLKVSKNSISIKHLVFSIKLYVMLMCLISRGRIFHSEGMT